MNTVEELMLSLHVRKRALIAKVLAGTDTAGKLGTDELIPCSTRACESRTTRC